MPLKHKLWYAAAFLHLLMTALFAGHFVESGYIKTTGGIPEHSRQLHRQQ
jgi:hypothetical protein